MIDWSILGINETKDEEIITNAYRQILSVTNPEDDAEGFMRLRQAYEDAIAYARSEIETVEFDNTPIGNWLKKVDEVAYVRFASVYRQFTDVNTFIKEIEKLIGKQDR